VRIVVIGAGASGFFGAIAAAESNPNAQVTLFEAGPTVLAKVKISGGGRCNVTHACYDAAALVQHYPRGGKALRGVFTRFQPRDTVAWFTDRGVMLKTEPDGRLFPESDDSQTIIDCLNSSAAIAGVKIKTQAAVKKIIRQDHGFTLVFRNDETLECDRVLLATGSSAVGHQIAKDLGHTLEQSVPSLFTFNIRDPRLTDLPGVSVPMAKLKLNGLELGTKLEQSGPLLVTHWGLSGPAVLKLSAWGARLLHQINYQAQLNINWLPNTNPETLKDSLIKVKSQLARKTVAAQCPVLLPRRLWESLTIAAGISPEMRWSDLSKPMLNLLLQELLNGTYQISGKGVFKEEFVTCGGVNLKEVDFKTMESRICPGLYFSGEVLDIDGVTGGFNFQSAWSTGWIAGNAMVLGLTE